MYSPNPILVGQTSAAGFILPVTTERGGMAGYILLSQSGPAVVVEVSAGGGAWTPPALPHTLVAGGTLRLTRLSASSTLSTLHMLAPIDTGPAPEGDGSIALQNGVPVTGVSYGGAGEPVTLFSVTLPAGITLQLTQTGAASIPVNLFESSGQPGSTVPLLDGQTRPFAGLDAGTYFLVLEGQDPFSDVTLTASWA